MKSWVLLLSHFLHVLGAIAWIGGIVMIIYVILPSSKATIESTTMVGKLMKEVARRFTPLANISIFMLIGTGIVIASYDGSYSSIRNWNGASHLLIIFKGFLKIQHSNLPANRIISICNLIDMLKFRHRFSISRSADRWRPA